MSSFIYNDNCKVSLTKSQANATIKENIMDNQKQTKLQLNAGTGMVGGIFVAALISLFVSYITGDQSVWSWSIPVGLASGLAIGAGHQRGNANRAN